MQSLVVFDAAMLNLRFMVVVLLHKIMTFAEKWHAKRTCFFCLSSAPSENAVNFREGCPSYHGHPWPITCPRSRGRLTERPVSNPLARRHSPCPLPSGRSGQENIYEEQQWRCTVHIGQGMWRGEGC